MVHRTVLAFPTVPGKSDADVKHMADQFHSRGDEYREARRRAGISFERAYLQRTPMGVFVVAYVESEKPFSETAAGFASSDLAMDKEFVRHVRDVHGVDLTQPPSGPPPEALGEWVDPEVSERRRGLAFVAPVMPGKADIGREFATEAFDTRRDELAGSRRSWGQNAEVVTLMSTPMGDMIAVYLEANDPVEGNRRFAASTESFDTWFKGQCAGIFPPQVDFNEPLPPVEEIFDSETVGLARQQSGTPT